MPHNSESLARHHETQWIERRVGTRTRASRLGHSNDRTNVNQFPGGPVDDCAVAIVRCGKSSGSINQRRHNSIKPSNDRSRCPTIRRVHRYSELNKTLNMPPRTENILALPQNESLSNRRPKRTVIKPICPEPSPARSLLVTRRLPTTKNQNSCQHFNKRLIVFNSA